jgi:ubiquinone/menaquinone biosynthesis C-methylase UbiE
MGLRSLAQSRPSGRSVTRKVTWIYDSPLGSKVYDLWRRAAESQAHGRALNAANPQSGESILEVAIGTGVLFEELARIDSLKCCVGLEQSEAMLLRSRRRLYDLRRPRHKLCRGDARFLPFADGTFDLILNCYLMGLLSENDIRLALREFRRTLKGTGRLVFLVMTEQNLLLQAIWMWLYAHLPGLVGGCRPVAIAESLPIEGWRVDLREQILQLGFRSELVLARPAF